MFIPPAPPLPFEWQRARERAHVAKREGRHRDAAEALAEALDAAAREGAGMDVIAGLWNTRADALRRVGSPAEALDAARAGLAARRGAGVAEILVGNDLMMLSQILEELGQRAEALDRAREALSIYTRVHGANHGEVRFIEGVIARLT